jgi:predicted SAM-dependent methyltransferase
MAASIIDRIVRKISEALRVQRYRVSGKILIGAAGQGNPGWLPTEKRFLDVTERGCFTLYWKPGSRRAFLAEHVWEHLDEEEAGKAIANCFEFLRPGGRLRLAVPDGCHPDPAYIESVRPGGTGAGADDHKVLYNYGSLSGKLALAGFRVELLEYWDESGRFHAREWSPEDGHIRRSSRHDPRNRAGTLAYTSLIVDGIKPRCA